MAKPEVNTDQAPGVYPYDSGTVVFNPQHRTRRQLLKGGVGTAVAAAAAYCLWNRWLFPESNVHAAAQPPAFPLGPVAQFLPNTWTPVAVRNDKNSARTDAYVVWNDGHNGYKVLSAACTHNGCTVLWTASQSRFVCPCHGGAFDASGKNVAGPPPRPLPAYAARVQQGVLYAVGIPSTTPG